MNPLRALIVEDSEDDTVLLVNELRRGGYDPHYRRVETAETMHMELAMRNWDIVFSDFSMPNFNAFAALESLRGSQQDIPFIIVSGTIGEDRAVTAMKAGAHDYILKGNLKRLVPAVERELREARIREQRRQADKTIRQLAYSDPITGLPNRTRFRELAQGAIENRQLGQHPAALLLMDLDHFKEVNDTLGYNCGDDLLKQVGRRVQNALSLLDMVARLGGDEFGILLSRLESAEDLQNTIRKIHECLEEPFTISGIPINVETSIGVAKIPEHADDADVLLQRAEIAMYRAKHMASSYAVYAPEFNPYNAERLGLMAELRKATEQNQLLLYFQPKLELKTGCICSAEALVRWQHPRLGMLPPNEFILPAEKTGLIRPLTRWVLSEALKYNKSLRSAGLQLQVAVNLSARSLYDPHMPDMIEEMLASTGVEPSQLMLEVTESAIVLDPVHAEQNMILVSRMGVRFSIDDFGTGYTSLSSIKHLPVSEIKIDKSFVTNMLTDTKDEKLVRTVIELGHNFGLTVVAEGVETQQVLDALADLGCDKAQGYFISKPQSGESLKNWFSSSPYKIGAAGQPG